MYSYSQGKLIWLNWQQIHLYYCQMELWLNTMINSKQVKTNQ